jgi:hypothetical protein
MQIFVVMPGGRVLTLEVEDTWEVAALKAQIQHAAAIPPARQRLIHGSKLGGEPHRLQDTCTLREYNIEREATLQLAVLPPPMVVELNVGGERHTTLLSTLCCVRGSWLWETFHGLRQGSAGAFAPAALTARGQGTAEEGVPPVGCVLARDGSGAFVIDCDKASFRFVLAYLRHLCRRTPHADVATEVDPAVPPEVARIELPPELHAELQGMKLSALMQRAGTVGVDAQLLSEAMDTADIKQSVIQLIADVVGTPELDLPAETADLKQLIAEAEFFRLPELAAACRRKVREACQPSHALVAEMDARAFQPLEQASLVQHGVTTLEQLELLLPSDFEAAQVDVGAAAQRVAAGHQPVSVAERAELRELLGREAGRISAEARGAFASFVGSVDRLLDMQLGSHSADAAQLGLNLVENRVLNRLLRTQGVRTERQQQYSQHLQQNYGLSPAGADSIVAAGCMSIGDIIQLLAIPAELERLGMDRVPAQGIKLRFMNPADGVRLEDDGSTIVGTSKGTGPSCLQFGGVGTEELHLGRHCVQVTIPANHAGGHPYMYFGVVGLDYAPHAEKYLQERSDVEHSTFIVQGAGKTLDVVVDIDRGTAGVCEDGVWRSLPRFAPGRPSRWAIDVFTSTGHGDDDGVVTRVHVHAKSCPHVPRRIWF